MSIEAARSHPVDRTWFPGGFDPEWWSCLQSLYRDPPGRTYDSVVIAGADIAALTFAARLARSPALAGRVVVVASPPADARRLSGNVGLHSLALEEICRAAGCDAEDLLQAAGGAPSFVPLRRGGNAGWRIGRRTHDVAGRGRPAGPLIYGVRHDAIEAALRRITGTLGVLHVAESPRTARQLRALAPGAQPLLVNATEDPRLLGGLPAPIRRRFLLVQSPFRQDPCGRPASLAPGIAVDSRLRHGGRLDGCRIAPFSDPSRPAARWCGRLWRIVENDAADPRCDLEQMTEALFRLAERLGLTPDAAAESLGCTIGTVASPLRAGAVPGVLELGRACAAAGPLLALDGQAAARSGLSAAEAVLRGGEPERAVARALRPLRWRLALQQRRPAGGAASLRQMRDGLWRLSERLRGQAG